MEKAMMTAELSSAVLPRAERTKERTMATAEVLRVGEPPEETTCFSFCQVCSCAFTRAVETWSGISSCAID